MALGSNVMLAHKKVHCFEGWRATTTSQHPVLRSGVRAMTFFSLPPPPLHLTAPFSSQKRELLLIIVIQSNGLTMLLLGFFSTTKPRIDLFALLFSHSHYYKGAEGKKGTLVHERRKKLEMLCFWSYLINELLQRKFKQSS